MIDVVPEETPVSLGNRFAVSFGAAPAGLAIAGAIMVCIPSKGGC